MTDGRKYDRYILFMYDWYYPSGGMRDIRGSYPTIAEAKDAAKNADWQYNVIEIVDRDTWRMSYKKGY